MAGGFESAIYNKTIIILALLLLLFSVRYRSLAMSSVNLFPCPQCFVFVSYIIQMFHFSLTIYHCRATVSIEIEANVSSNKSEPYEANIPDIVYDMSFIQFYVKI